ncbi:helix-turn-helix domain-containing protein [Alcaligenes faecalis]|uniref:helix-turn-helix domain-containing protein n=1 Tax=Alcaligenes faecalis TaxID=511 RepID=UPI000E11F565|nr:helix-turn-helix domain-containing protein [Alcaligenes faecalis]SSY77041.1 Transcriptional activator feaR [Alcaligenes faecalis subsp. faecalis]
MTAIIAVKPGDSFEHWHEVTCRQFSQTECSQIARPQFQARVTLTSFGGLGLSSIWSATPQGEAIRVSRRQADIRKDQRDCFMLWLMLDGHIQLSQDGRYVSLGKGDLVLQDQSRPFDLELGSLAHAAMVMIPRPLLASRLPSVGNLAARRIAAHSRLGPMAGALVKQLLGMGEAAADGMDQRVTASVLDIFSAVFESDAPALSRGTRQERRLEQVQAYMRAHLHEDALDVDQIARASSMATRTLYRLFALEATTPMQWLWEQRLIQSYRLLAEGKPKRVTEVAMACGFKDLSHFSRLFQARFGQSPSTLGYTGRS